MKTINSAASESFEFAKRILYTFEVSVIGILIPVLFIAGITNGGRKETGKYETSINKTKEMAPVKGIVDFSQILSNQNS